MTPRLATTGAASAPGRWRRVGAGVVIGLVALTVFGRDLSEEPHWVDESAIISKSFYLSLLLRGERNDRAWLEYPAFDHPPLGQYLTGAGLLGGGYRFPPRWVIDSWYRDTRTRGESNEALEAARWPSVILGAVGCVAIYALGTLARDSRVGTVAALLLMVNPLYRLHARRAIADVPCEALVLSALAVGLLTWRNTLAGRWGVGRRLSGSLATGCLAGLAVLAKLNGVLSLITLGAWAVLAIALPRFGWGRKLAVSGEVVLAGIVAFGLFVALNPTMTADPEVPHARPSTGLVRRVLERIGSYYTHRAAVMDPSRTSFTRDALRTPLDRLKVVAIQGFGRFGPFGPRHSDSTRRFDSRQDWGAAIWGPWVALGLFWAVARGRGQLLDGLPPTAWAVLVQTLVAMAAVSAFIPLAWDRYYLPMVAGCALVASGAVVSAFDFMASRWPGKPHPGPANRP